MIPQLSKCINSLWSSSKNIVDLSVIVVSENSLKYKYVDKLNITKLISASKQSGFANINNVAIETSINTLKPDYFLLINDDAWVKYNFFNSFTKIKNLKKLDVIIPLVYKSDMKTIDSFGLEYFSSGYAATVHNKNTESKLFSGSLVLIKSSLLRKTKKIYGFYFNPIFYYYYEDVELSLRFINLKARITQDPTLIGYHINSCSSDEMGSFKFFYSYRNIIWLIIISWPFSTIIKNLLRILIVQFAILLYLTLSFGIKLYPRILYNTSLNIKKLLLARKFSLSKHTSDYDFIRILDSRMFRTKKGIYI
jgi:GT2 family glycosyltransferase